MAETNQLWLKTLHQHKKNGTLQEKSFRRHVEANALSIKVVALHIKANAPGRSLSFMRK
jgi:hypothetical protein